MEDPIQPAVAMTGHDDQVRADVFSFPYDLIKGSSNSEAASALWVLRAQMFLDQSKLSLGVTFLDAEQLDRSQAYFIVKRIQFFENMQKNEFGIEKLG